MNLKISCAYLWFLEGITAIKDIRDIKLSAPLFTQVHHQECYLQASVDPYILFRLHNFKVNMTSASDKINNAIIFENYDWWNS